MNIKRTDLYDVIQHDMDVFNDRFADSAVRALVANSVELDEKNASKAERETVKTRTKLKIKRQKSKSARKPNAK